MSCILRGEEEWAWKTKQRGILQMEEGRLQRPRGVGTSGSLGNTEVLEGRRGLARAPLRFLSEAGTAFC